MSKLLNMLSKKTDLHIHTKHSDGEKTVAEILAQAEKQGLRIISFCDHNTLEAYKELEEHPEIKSKFSGKIIPGIEFDFKHDGKVFHMLGYNFDIDKLDKSKYIDRRTAEELRQEQEERLKYLMSVCKKQGIIVSPDLKIEGNAQADAVIKESIIKHTVENKQHLKSLFGKNGKGSFYRGHVTNPMSPFYIDMTQNLPTANQIANTIHAAGGKVVLAHVFDYKSINNEVFLNEIYNLGILDGIECVHTKHTQKQSERLIDFCIEHNLLMTGGSDFHTERKQTLGFTPIGSIQDVFKSYIFKLLTYNKNEEHEI